MYLKEGAARSSAGNDTRRYQWYSRRIAGVIPDISKEGAAPIVPGNTRGVVDGLASVGSKSVVNVYQRREKHQ